MVDVGVGGLVVLVTIIWLTSIVAAIACGDAVVELPGMGRSVFFYELSKVAIAYQLFNFVLKCFALIYGVTIILMIFVVFGHVDIRWV